MLLSLTSISQYKIEPGGSLYLACFLDTMEVLEAVGMMWVLITEEADTLANVGKGKGGGGLRCNNRKTILVE